MMKTNWSSTDHVNTKWSKMLTTFSVAGIVDGFPTMSLGCGHMIKMGAAWLTLHYAREHRKRKHHVAWRVS